MTVTDVQNRVSDNNLMTIPLTKWIDILVDEVQVYTCEHGYLAKRFDEIHFNFCSNQEVKQIIADNLYTILKNKYFAPLTEEKLDRIQRIVNTFCINYCSTLKKVSFDADSTAYHVENLPNYCIAFRNGVYDFKHDKWFFKYDIINLESIGSQIYVYDFKYIIRWYMNFDFEPLPINIMNTSCVDAVNIFKELVKDTHNYCFELCYNISHNEINQFDIKRFQHLCEILGYTMLQSFSQNFVMLIGSGQNGKNSLFDGCFTNRLVPRPASNDLDAIESDRFITGALENHSHNIFLESSAKKYVESKMIKALTGSMFQTIENKGVSKYSGIINCKYVFAGNDQDAIKFSDTTTGFRRRINIMEIFYHWDSQRKFLVDTDYYDTTFSDSLVELTSDVSNNVVYCYLAMLGIRFATSDFSSNFKFNFNDWNISYTDINSELMSDIFHLSIDDYYNALRRLSPEVTLTAMFDSHKKRIYSSYASFDEFLTDLKDDESRMSFFNNLDDCYVSLKFLHDAFFPAVSQTAFTRQIKKMFNIYAFPFTYGNIPYINVLITSNFTKVIH